MIEIEEEKYNMLIEALRFYADPDTYFATYISADRPAGGINDDWSVHYNYQDYEEGDVRPGYLARKALYSISEEMLQPADYDLLREMGLYVSYYDQNFKEEMAKRGVIYG